MYEAFFHLNRRPFSATPQSDCFFAPPHISQTLNEILICLHGGQGIAILTGPAGIGKTQFCRVLLSRLGETFLPVFLPHSNFPSRRALLQALLYELGHPYVRLAAQELRLELATAVRAIGAGRAGVGLVIDEAHMLSEKLLEEVRTITYLVDDGRPLIRVLLSGQPELDEMLARPALAALSQRIGCQVALEPLSLRESADYIGARLRWAGGQPGEVFTPEALEAVCRAGDGLPRCLNQLCDHALMLAAERNLRPVDAPLIQAALEGLRQLPLHWNDLPNPFSGRGGFSAPLWPAAQPAARSGDVLTGRLQAPLPPQLVAPPAGRGFAALEVGVDATSSDNVFPGPHPVDHTRMSATRATGSRRSQEEATVTEQHLVAVSADAELLRQVGSESIAASACGHGACGRPAEPIWETGETATPAATAGEVEVDEPRLVADEDSWAMEVEGAVAPQPEPAPAGSSAAGPELRADSRSQPTLRVPSGPATRDGGSCRFIEEPVHDRYAALDAGLPLPPPPLRPPRRSLETLSPPATADATDMPQLLGDDSLWDSRPDRLVDRLLPLIDDMIASPDAVPSLDASCIDKSVSTPGANPLMSGTGDDGVLADESAGDLGSLDIVINSIEAFLADGDCEPDAEQRMLRSRIDRPVLAVGPEQPQLRSTVMFESEGLVEFDVVRPVADEETDGPDSRASGTSRPCSQLFTRARRQQRGQ